MTYIIQETELTHYGVPGMKWGVRKAQSSGGGKKSAPSKKPLSSSEAAARRKAIGKTVVVAVVATAGGLGAAAIGGPVVGAAVTAALRGISNTLQPPADQARLKAISERAKELTKEINAENRVLENLTDHD